MVGDLLGYGQVWYHPDAITNILSLNNVQKKFRVTYDSANGNKFVVHSEDYKRIFKATTKGLYVLDSNEEEYQFLETEMENSRSYSKRARHGAAKAKELFGIVQYPSLTDFKNMVRFNMIKNCPISIEDVEAMVAIYGLSVEALKGKTVRKKSPKVQIQRMLLLPLSY